MRPYKSTLLSSTMVPVVMVAAGILTGFESPFENAQIVW